MNGQLRWKLAIRDSTLDATAKHVALTLDTWMDAHGHCFPERPTIARGASLSVRAALASSHRCSSVCATSFNEPIRTQRSSGATYRWNESHEIPSTAAASVGVYESRCNPDARSRAFTLVRPVRVSVSRVTVMRGVLWVGLL